MLELTKYLQSTLGTNKVLSMVDTSLRSCPRWTPAWGPVHSGHHLEVLSKVDTILRSCLRWTPAQGPVQGGHQLKVLSKVDTSLRSCPWWTPAWGPVQGGHQLKVLSKVDTILRSCLRWTPAQLYDPILINVLINSHYITTGAYIMQCMSWVSPWQ
jgi:hypothetical protein